MLDSYETKVDNGLKRFVICRRLYIFAGYCSKIEFGI